MASPTAARFDADLAALNESTTIPRVIHRIWLDEPMPSPFVAHGERWQELHPDWEVRDSRSSAELGNLVNRDLVERARQLCPRDPVRFIADVVRLELLWRDGGVYVDTDTAPVRPIDGLVDGLACFAGVSPQHTNGDHPITNAVMGAAPGDPWIGACIDALPAAVETHRRRSLAVMAGPWHLTRVYRSGWWPTVNILPADELYVHWVEHHWNTAARRRGVGVR